MNAAEKRLDEGKVVSIAPDVQLRWLFRREAELKREAAAVAVELQQQRELYARRQGLLSLPRMERLRTLFGPDRGFR